MNFTDEQINMVMEFILQALNNTQKADIVSGFIGLISKDQTTIDSIKAQIKVFLDQKIEIDNNNIAGLDDEKNAKLSALTDDVAFLNTLKGIVGNI